MLDDSRYRSTSKFTDFYYERVSLYEYTCTKIPKNK